MRLAACICRCHREFQDANSLLHHHIDQCWKIDFRTPAQLGLKFRGIRPCEVAVDLAAQQWIEFDEPGPVETADPEGDFAEFRNGMSVSGSDDEIRGRVALHDEM